MPVDMRTFQHGERQFCHGNRLSLRLLEEEHFIFWFPNFGYYGPRGGKRKLSLHYMNPDGYRKYKSGTNRTEFAEPSPWPHLSVCQECGFIFGGGFRFHSESKNVQRWLKEKGGN